MRPCARVYVDLAAIKEWMCQISYQLNCNLARCQDVDQVRNREVSLALCIYFSSIWLSIWPVTCTRALISMCIFYTFVRLEDFVTSIFPKTHKPCILNYQYYCTWLSSRLLVHYKACVIEYRIWHRPRVPFLWFMDVTSFILNYKIFCFF
jgi:hypothetical protein